MKRIIIVLMILVSGKLNAQKLPDMTYFKVRINEHDKTIVAEINRPNSTTSIKPGLMYYWYNANSIHSSQGGYSGTLLNGQYNEYFLSKNLKQQGIFKNGLKVGTWKDWNDDGTLIKSVKWKNGTIVPDGSKTFWMKLDVFHFFNKKAKDTAKSLPAKSG